MSEGTQLPKTLVILRMWSPRPNSAAISRILHHTKLDWALADGWNVEFWGLRRAGGTVSDDGRIPIRGPRLPDIRWPVPLLTLLSWMVHFVLGMIHRRPGVVVSGIPLLGLGAALTRLIGPLDAPFVVRVVGRTATNAVYLRPSRMRSRVIEGVEAFVLRRADLVLPVSAFTRSLVEGVGVPADRTLLAPSPSGAPGDLRPDSAPERDASCVACAARFVPEKGIDVLVKAFAMAVGDFPQASLELAGDGVERAMLERLTQDLGIADRVRWHGYLPASQMLEFFSAAAIVVLPSRVEEGLGHSLVEAGLAGCALVGTDLGGTSEIVRPGHTGVLVPPDDPYALADALNSLLGSPDKTRRLGEGAREEALEIYDRKQAARTRLRVLLNGYVSSGEAPDA